MPAKSQTAEKQKPFKDIYFNRENVAWIAARCKKAWRAFPESAFLTRAMKNWQALELKARIERIAEGLEASLPTDYPRALGILQDALGAPPPQGDGTDFGEFRKAPFMRFVSRRGLDHFDLSIAALGDMTRHFSAEFDIRYFIAADQTRAFKALREWMADDDWRRRRLASEGARPRLPWGLQLKNLVADPEPLKPILAHLRHDPIEAVRRSAANNLNDIAKDHPDTVVGWLNGWGMRKDTAQEKVARHALRHLIKQGHKGALAFLGFAHQADIKALSFTVAPKRVAVGGKITLSADLKNTGSKPQSLAIDYAVHHKRANGDLSPKVFKWTVRNLQPGATIALSRSHSFKPVTTRKYYAGNQRVELRVNGKTLAAVDILLNV